MKKYLPLILLFTIATWFVSGITSSIFATTIFNPQYLISKKNHFNLFAIGASFSEAGGNSEYQKIDAALTGRYFMKDKLLLGIAQGTYGESNGETFTEHYMAHFRYLQEFTKLLALELYTQEQYNRFTRIDLRSLFGLGPRFTFISNDKMELSIGSSYLFEHTSYNQAFEPIWDHNLQAEVDTPFPDSGASISAHRWSNYIYIDWVISEKIIFAATLYIQPCFSDFNDYRLFNDNSLQFKVSETINFLLSASIAKDSMPPHSIKALDSFAKMGLTFQWKGDKQE